LSNRRFRTTRIAGVMFAASLTVAITAGALSRQKLFERAARQALDTAGVPIRSLTVQSVGLNGAVLGPLELGDPTGPSASGIEIGWNFRSLMHARLSVVWIRGLTLTVAASNGTLAVLGLPLSRPAAGGGALPIDTIKLDDTHLKFVTGNAQTTLSLNALVSMEATVDGIRLNCTDCEVASERDGREFDNITASFTTAGTIATLGLSGRLRDMRAPAQFVPLTVDIQGHGDGQSLTVTGHAVTADKSLALVIAAKHDLKSGQGTAALSTTPPIVFKADGLQPPDLSPIIGESLGRVSGSLSMTANATWGGKALSDTLTITPNNLDLEGDLVGLSGLDGQVVLDMSAPVHTAGVQHLAGRLRIATLPPGPFDLNFSLSGGDRIDLQEATLQLAGGSLSLSGTNLRSGRPFETALTVQGVDLGAILTLIGIDGLSGSGTIDGRIPIGVDSKGVTIIAGRLKARGPGVVRYTGAGLPAAVSTPAGATTDTVTLLRQALADFHYTSLSLGLDRAASGEGSLLIGLKGANPAVLNGYPFALNIRVDANFDRLAAIFNDGYKAAGDLLRRSAQR
jgi:hypothetical protein